MAGEDSDTSIKLYLREIMRVPLLTPQDEITLAARIKKGDSEARAWMIKANLRLVVKIAHDYLNLGLPFPDLISEGNIGLMKAVERFDPAKGGKLSTYVLGGSSNRSSGRWRTRVRPSGFQYI
jgi:RNA polymerase primary sigma factor